MKITHYKDVVIIMPKQKIVVIKRQFYNKTKSGKMKGRKRNFSFLSIMLCFVSKSYSEIISLFY